MFYYTFNFVELCKSCNDGNQESVNFMVLLKVAISMIMIALTFLKKNAQLIK